MEKKRSNFTGSIGFVLAAAGSAVGLGNIWRFPYLAAKGGGGVFILCYVVLALTFGFTLLTTEIAIGRKTGQSPLTAYEQMHKGWGGIGVLYRLSFFRIIARLVDGYSNICRHFSQVMGRRQQKTDILQAILHRSDSRSYGC